jgi:hypothetical protein
VTRPQLDYPRKTHELLQLLVVISLLVFLAAERKHEAEPGDHRTIPKLATSNFRLLILPVKRHPILERRY